MAEEDIRKEVEELEKACDMAVIEYFEATIEYEALESQIHILKGKLQVMQHVTLPDMRKKFERAKVAHLRAKHQLPAK